MIRPVSDWLVVVLDVTLRVATMIGAGAAAAALWLNLADRRARDRPRVYVTLGEIVAGAAPQRGFTDHAARLVNVGYGPALDVFAELHAVTAILGMHYRHATFGDTEPVLSVTVRAPQPFGSRHIPVMVPDAALGAPLDVQELASWLGAQFVDKLQHCRAALEYAVDESGGDACEVTDECDVRVEAMLAIAYTDRSTRTSYLDRFSVVAEGTLATSDALGGAGFRGEVTKVVRA